MGQHRRQRRVRVRRGFIVIFGWRHYTFNERTAPVETVCPACREQATLRGRYIRQHFHIFWLPLFPIGEPHRFTECTSCKAQIDTPLEVFRKRYERSNGATIHDAIAMFHQLREAPSDGALLERLMAMYESLDEPGEALSAARAYPAALARSAAAQQRVARLSAGAPLAHGA